MRINHSTKFRKANRNIEIEYITPTQGSRPFAKRSSADYDTRSFGHEDSRDFISDMVRGLKALISHSSCLQISESRNK